jgi:fibronectin-binding autotransporter adhesin
MLAILQAEFAHGMRLGGRSVQRQQGRLGFGQQNPGDFFALQSVRLLRAFILSSSALMLPGLPAVAQDATWLTNPGSNEYGLGSNWSTGTVPTGTAFFDSSNTTSLTLGGNTTLGGWTFNAGASDYIFTTNDRSITFNGAGIVVNGGSISITNTTNGFVIFGGGLGNTTAGTADITNNGNIQFLQNSTADEATILNAASTFGGTSEISFFGNSTAGNATFTNGQGGAAGKIIFLETSTAGDATFTNVKGSIDFTADSTAGTADIIGEGGFVTLSGNSTLDQAEVSLKFGSRLQFNDDSKAGSANITSDLDGVNVIAFAGDSTAENATISSAIQLEFSDNATAGNASITTGSGSQTFFFDNSTAGSASIDNGGTVDFSASSGPAGDGKLSAGSIAGSGLFYLGARELTVGGNNQNMAVSGIISDCGPDGDNCQAGATATGGSLVKTGAGTMTLSGNNTYTGATTVNGGTLIVNGNQTAAIGLTTVNSGGTLGGTGTIGGHVTVGDGGTLAPGGAGGGVGNLTIAGNLTLSQGSTLNYSFGAADVVGEALNDLVTVEGNLVLDGI